MHNTNIQKIYKKTARHYVRVMTFAVLGVVLGAVLAGMLLPRQESAPTLHVNVQATTTNSLSRALPVHLRIPKLSIDTTFVAPLGLNTDKTVSVPDSYEQVGWYKNGVTPGEIGPAVILGHIDSYTGPAVFFHLGQLAPGDAIYVDRDDGTTATFIVTKLERYNQDAFPTELVYGPVPYPGLRLVTCSGVYDRTAKRYDRNLVVYATLEN